MSIKDTARCPLRQAKSSALLPKTPFPKVADILRILSPGLIAVTDARSHFLEYATQLAGALRHTIFVDQVKFQHFVSVR